MTTDSKTTTPQTPTITVDVAKFLGSLVDQLQLTPADPQFDAAVVMIQQARAQLDAIASS